ncbi:type I restriction enzyme, S subunit [Caminicella sporogenes DSM 14501]|uniref:Type I restriction enzyme, S subunit n=1 Tax=Caminicella sporogenes DSM 14501 TaxID=1121266 RepID=A0A1M6N3A7_9FIRM|nr:restriction endonuclease subunit S [Caminicella sporogenes]SHJ90165.1 type I restriction enzyme, S subunit [Caminicella sporogenes DSM 14501]
MKYKICDICEINRENLSKNDRWEYINYLDTSNLNKGIINEIHYLVVGKDKVPSRAKRKVKENDILISTVRPNQKHYGILKKTVNNMIVSTGFAVLTPNSEIVTPEYLYRFLTQDGITNYLQAVAETSTSAYPSIKPSVIGELEIDLPPLEEQKAIVHILSTLDEKIEVNNKINKTIEKMAQAIFKHWFIDFEFPNENGEPYKSSGGEMVESELGMIPKGWEVIDLGKIIKFKKGKKPKEIKETFFQNYKKYLTIDVLNRNSTLYANSEKMIIADEFDTLMVMDGASSGTVYYGQNGIVASTLARVDIQDKTLGKDFIYYVLKYFEDDIKANTTGSAIPHTDKEYVYSIKICIPNDFEILERFNSIVRKLRETVINNEEESAKLSSIRDTLLPKLMSGEIRVPLDN